MSQEKRILIGIDTCNNKVYHCRIHNISENGREYCIRSDNLKTIIYVAKGTEFGNRIAELIKNNATRPEIEEVAMQISLPYLTVGDILSLLIDEYNRGLKDGEIKAIKNVRQALGLPLSF